VSRVVSINGEIVATDRAVVSVFDRGFLYGDGVFETMRAYGGRVFERETHLQRLARSARTLHIPLPVTIDALAYELDSALAASGEDEATVRVLVTRGAPAEPSIAPPNNGAARATRVVMVERVAIPAPEVYARGLSAITLAWGRIADAGPMASAKLLPYVTSVVALAEARAKGADDAVFVGHDGCLREATTANVFVVDEDGALVTPSEGPGVLGGITRGHVIDLALSLGLSCALRAVPRSTLASAREVFLTSSVREIVSVVRVDNKTIGAGVPGEVAKMLHTAYRYRAGAHGPPPWAAPATG
jgi:branched-chain amino acid aminotransferase